MSLICILCEQLSFSCELSLDVIYWEIKVLKFNLFKTGPHERLLLVALQILIGRHWLCNLLILLGPFACPKLLGWADR